MSLGIILYINSETGIAGDLRSVKLQLHFSVEKDLMAERPDSRLRGKDGILRPA